MDKSNFQKNIEIISPNDHYKRNQFESTGFRWADEENLVAISNGNGEITLKSDEILMVARELLNNYDVLKKWYEVIEKVVEEISERYNMLPSSIRRNGFSICSDGMEGLIESFTSADDYRELISPVGGSNPSIGMQLEDEILKRLEEKSIEVIESRGGRGLSRYMYSSVELFLSYTWLNPKNPVHSGGPGSSVDPDLESKITNLLTQIDNDKDFKAPQSYLNIIKLSSYLLRNLDSKKSIWTITPYQSDYEIILNWFAMMDILASDEFTCRFIEYEVVREVKSSYRPYKFGYVYNYENHEWTMDFMIEQGLPKLIYVITKAMYTYASTFTGGIDLKISGEDKLENVDDLFKGYCF